MISKQDVVRHFKFLQHVYLRAPQLYTPNPQLKIIVHNWKNYAHLTSAPIVGHWFQYLLKLNPVAYQSFYANRGKSNYLNNCDLEAVSVQQGLFMKSLFRQNNLHDVADPTCYQAFLLCTDVKMTIDIYLAWLAHMADHPKYVMDTIQYTGKILPHDSLYTSNQYKPTVCTSSMS